MGLIPYQRPMRRLLLRPLQSLYIAPRKCAIERYRRGGGSRLFHGYCGPRNEKKDAEKTRGGGEEFREDRKILETNQREVVYGVLEGEKSAKVDMARGRNNYQYNYSTCPHIFPYRLENEMLFQSLG